VRIGEYPPPSRYGLLTCHEIFPNRFGIRPIILGIGAPITSPGIRVVRTPKRWTIGGGVASTRSECVGAESTILVRESHTMHPKSVGRHPLSACRAGRERQSNRATPVSAVENERRAMASKNSQVAGGGRGPKGLDKKPIGLQLG
jgi:hypothetical protein